MYNARLDRRKNVFTLHLGVVGYALRDPSDVLALLTSWANSLRFNYVRALERDLEDWGYFLFKLSKDKTCLGVVPEDTREFTDIMKCNVASHEKMYSGKKLVWVFADRSSPLENLYVAFEEQCLGDKTCVRVKGFSVNKGVNTDIHVILADTYPLEQPDLITDRNIHTLVHPEANPQVKRLFKKIRKIISSPP